MQNIDHIESVRPGVKYRLFPTYKKFHIKSYLIWFLYFQILVHVERDMSNSIWENEIIIFEVLQWNQRTWQW